MNVRVQLCAVARQIVGSEAVELSLPDGATAGDLKQALLARAPGLSILTGTMRLAVNNAYARDDLPIPADAEVACIPPVSGG